MKLNIISLAGLSLGAALPAQQSNDLVQRQAQGTQTQPYQAGGFYTDPATSVSAVSLQMQVPTLTYVAGAGATQAVTFWVGIFGDTCGFQSALLQTGIQGYIHSDGSTSWSAFYEWAPDPAYTLDVAINTGDQLGFQVVATGTNTGKVTVNNFSSGQSASMDISGSLQLCTANAEWVVEDLALPDGLPDTTFANFGTVTFTNSVAIDSAGYINAADGALVYMVENGQSRVNVGVDGSTLTVQFAG